MNDDREHDDDQRRDGDVHTAEDEPRRALALPRSASAASSSVFSIGSAMPAGYPGALGSNRARRTSLHRERGGRPADRGRAAGAPDRLRPRPAGDGADRVRRPAQAEAAARRPRRRRDRRTSIRTGCWRSSARSPAIHRFPGNMAKRVQELCAVVAEEYDGDASRVWRDATDTRRPEAADRGAPGLRRDEGEGARLGARAPLRQRDGGAARPGPSDARRRRLARGAGRVPGGEARVQGLAARRSRCDRAQDVPRRRPVRRRRRTRGRRVPERRPHETLELALYDIRLHDEAAELVSEALVDAQERGVRVRLVYNVDHPGPIPVPPPPQTAPELLEALPIATRPIPGVPDLMHHKYAIRDRETIWTGSMNWTQDSWSRQENVVAIVDVARARTRLRRSTSTSSGRRAT